jgi:hypothetical protein
MSEETTVPVAETAALASANVELTPGAQASEKPSLAKSIGISDEKRTELEAMTREDLEKNLQEMRAAAKPNAMTGLLITECERILATK